MSPPNSLNRGCVRPCVRVPQTTPSPFPPHLLLGDVPDDDRAVHVARGDKVVAGVERDAQDRPAVALQRGREEGGAGGGEGGGRGEKRKGEWTVRERWGERTEIRSRSFSLHVFGPCTPMYIRACAYKCRLQLHHHSTPTLAHGEGGGGWGREK